MDIYLNIKKLKVLKMAKGDTMTKINVGDMFLIPFQNKKITGKILWVSKRKNAIA